MNLKGKVILITGGTSGIGKATALAAAREGAHVVITGRRAEEGRRVAAEAGTLGVRSVFVQGDVTDEAHVQNAVKQALTITGKLDGAFNNAGLELGGVPLTETTADQYRKIFDVNVLGVILSLKHQMRAMLNQGFGSIVNNASIAGSIGMPNTSVYIASKHAVLGLTKTAALEGAPRGVRVNTVSPAAIDTEMFDRFTGGKNPDTMKWLESMHPIGRIGRPEEIARPVLFLLGDESSFITGHDLKVDGGFTVP